MLSLLITTVAQLNFKHYDDPLCIGGVFGVVTHVIPDTSKCHYVLPGLSSLTGEWAGGGIINGKCEFCYSTFSEKECNDCLAKKAEAQPCSSGDGKCSGICPLCWESHEMSIVDSQPSACTPFSHIVHGFSLGSFKAWCPKSSGPCVAHSENCLNQGRCCSPTDKCMQQDDYYAQCREDCPTGWACNNVSKPLDLVFVEPTPLRPAPILVTVNEAALVPSPPAPVSPHQVEKTHYSDPKDGCLEDEKAVSVKGVDGQFCTSQCSIFHPCATDKPAGVTATPKCALEMSGSIATFCALVCTLTGGVVEGKVLDQKAANAQCGTNGSCKAVGKGGICTYDD